MNPARISVPEKSPYATKNGMANAVPAIVVFVDCADGGSPSWQQAASDFGGGTGVPGRKKRADVLEFGIQYNASKDS